MTKDAVLDILWKNADAYISGAALARALSVSRTAVWKAIEQLRADGYLIESVTNRGYRLSSGSDVLSASGVEKYLKSPFFSVQVHDSLPSTNTVLKGMAADGAPEGLTLIARQQTAGRGRMGRSFYSPADSGLYMSFLLRPRIPAAEATRITACAAVAVAQAIESLAAVPAQIKWVNDVLVNGKKVCGILTEASVDCESAMIHYAVVGIGVNACLPAGDFPTELRPVAGTVFGAERIPELRCRLAASILNNFMTLYEQPENSSCFDEYKKRSLVLGRPVNLLAPGREPVPALVLGLEPDYSLLVRLADGREQRVNSGEVSVRVT